VASIKALRDGLQTRLATITTIHAYDVQTGGERLSKPVVIVFPVPGDGRASAGGKYNRRFMIEVHCPLTMTLARAQDVLDDLIDDGSTDNIEDVIEADKTLGSIADSTRVDEFTAYGFSDLGGTDTLMLRIPVEVYA